MSMFYDNRVNQIRERRRVLNRIRHDIEAYENGEETEFSPDEQLPSPYLILCVRREFIVEDALFKLELVAAERPADLRKQLCIEFQGEEGVDEGGVSKEFFRLIIERVFSPDYGLFIFDDETDYFWFNPYPPIFGSEEEKEYMLIGMLFGLAIYNNITMDVHFPPVLFKKILGFDGLFEDLEHTHPSIYRSLITLLQYDSAELSIEDCFCLSYEVSSKTVFGQTVNHSLIQYGAEIPITEENRSDFVFRYSDWLLNKSIKKQFNAFLRGFELVTDESPLKVLFRPQQLEHLVCGEREYDWDKLREGCRYEGFSEFDKTIRLFWEVFDALSVEKRKKLLEFFTGSDRCPVGGLAKLKMTITKNGPESSRLPSAHTCFNILLLPEYQSKEILEERLLKALDNSIGFGMI